jgi:hypothetical protein
MATIFFGDGQNVKDRNCREWTRPCPLFVRQTGRIKWHLEELQ